MAKKIIKGALGVVAPLLGIGGKKKADTVATPVAATPVMPTADADTVLRAKRKAMAQQMQRGGRTSTMLTDNSDSLGG